MAYWIVYIWELSPYESVYEIPSTTAIVAWARIGMCKVSYPIPLASMSIQSQIYLEMSYQVRINLLITDTYLHDSYNKKSVTSIKKSPLSIQVAGERNPRARIKYSAVSTQGRKSWQRGHDDMN